MIGARTYLVVSAITFVGMAGRIGWIDHPALLQAAATIGLGFGLFFFFQLLCLIAFGAPLAFFIFMAVCIGKAIARFIRARAQPAPML